MADEMRGVPIGDLPGIESVPDDSLLVVEFLGKAYRMPGAVLRQLFQDILDAMGSSVDDVTDARLTAAIETVLSSGKYNGVSPVVEFTTDKNGNSVLHVVDAFGIKDYPVEVKGATDAVQYVPQELTKAQKKQARENIGATGGNWNVNDPDADGYIEGRTHWKEGSDTAIEEVIPETTLEFKENINFAYVNKVAEQEALQSNRVYGVMYNGVRYDCVGKESSDGVFVGNGSLLGIDNLEDTGEPFCILTFTSTIYMVFKHSTVAETVTIYVAEIEGWTYYPFEEGYLPEVAQNAVRYAKQSLSDAAKVQARKNIEASVVVSLSGNPVIGYTATLDGNAITGDKLDKMAQTGANVIGVAASGLRFRMPSNQALYEVAAGTVFRYENAVASRNPEILEDLTAHWFEFHARVNDVDYGIRYEADGEWQGYAVSSFLTFVLTEVDGEPSFSHNGQILPRWAVLELLNMASYTNRPVFCYQKNMRFYKDDGTAIIPAMYTPFSLMLSSAGEHIFSCEQDGYKYTYKVEQDTTRSTGASPTAEKTVAYKTAESKADDLELEEGSLFLLSAGERISPDGVTLPAGNVPVKKSLPEASEKVRGQLSIVSEDDVDTLYICMWIRGKYDWFKINVSGSNTAILGIATLGTMILGKE